MPAYTLNMQFALDPDFQINQNMTENKNAIYMHNGTSDSFFKSHYAINSMKGASIQPSPTDCTSLNFCCVIYNTDAPSAPHGLIALHDCLPLTAETFGRSFDPQEVP